MGGDLMKADLWHAIVLTCLIVLSIVMVMGCLGSMLIGINGPISPYYERTWFLPDDISFLEDIYQVKFPKDTQFVKFSGNQDSKTGDTNVSLSIKLPASNRDEFAKDWFQKHPNDNLAGSLEKYFEKNDILSMSKIYYNHSGDTLLKCFESIYYKVFFSSVYGWLICIITIIVTNVLFKRFSKKDPAPWNPPD